MSAVDKLESLEELFAGRGAARVAARSDPLPRTTAAQHDGRGREHYP
jgi:hypothetical protein